MFDSITQIVRSNQNGVMFRIGITVTHANSSLRATTDIWLFSSELV